MTLTLHIYYCIELCTPIISEFTSHFNLLDKRCKTKDGVDTYILITDMDE